MLDRHEGVARALCIVGILAARLFPAVDKEALLQLVIGLAHFDIAVKALEAQAFHGLRDHGWVGRFSLGHGFGQDGERVIDRSRVQIIVELLLEVSHDLLHLPTHVVVVVGNLIHAAGRCSTHGGRRACHTTVVGVELHVVQACLVRGLDQQRQV